MTKQIIACIDESSAALAVCDWAPWAGSRLNMGVTLLHVLDKPYKSSIGDLSGNIGLGSREYLLQQLTQLDEQRGRIAVEQGKEILIEAKARVEAGGVTTTGLQRHSSLVDTLVELESKASILIIGRNGESTQNTTSHIGSQLETAIRATHRPVLVALPGFKVPSRIMIAYDGSATSKKNLEYFASEPLLFTGMKIHLVMVGNGPNQELQFAHTKLADKGYDVVSACREGELDDVLCLYAQEQQIDLIVMGAYGHSAFRRFILGSNTTRMIHRTPVPLFLIR